MFDEFWEELTKELTKRWSAQELAMPLVFWLTGALSWVWHWQWVGIWQTIVDWIESINNAVAFIALAVAGLLLLSVSATVAAWMQLPLLRLMEGYWPWPLRRLRYRATEWLSKRLRTRENRWQELAAIDPENRTAAQLTECARLDAKLAHYPVDPRRLMPTPLGNILRSAEEYPQLRYGLAISVCWPRLWLVLPEETRTALAEARKQLDNATTMLFWGTLLAVWSFLAWWAALVAVAVVLVAYWRMVEAAGTYGDLLRAAFDVHRFSLYESLRWPLPDRCGEEAAHGERLTVYLFRGIASTDAVFTKASQARGGAGAAEQLTSAKERR